MSAARSPSPLAPRCSSPLDRTMSQPLRSGDTSDKTLSVTFREKRAFMSPICYKDRRSSWGARWGHEVLVRIETDDGLIGIGCTAPAPARMIVEGYLAHLLAGQDPADVERLWDQMYRSSLPYGRKGLAIMAISAVDIALWDVLGKAYGVPVYRLRYQQFGFTRFKLAMPHGPADGSAGIRENAALVERTRATVGPDADIMLDCYMAWDLEFTLRMAEAVRPYNVRWIEEVPAARRLRGLRRAAAPSAGDGGCHRRARVHALGLRRAAVAQVLPHHPARSGVVRRHQRGAPHRGAGERARRAGDPARGRPAALGIHWLAAQAPIPWAEYVVVANSVDGELRPLYPFMRGIPQPRDGFITPSDLPGLGIEVDPEWLDE